MAEIALRSVPHENVKSEKETISLTWQSCKWYVFFLLSMALIGLDFPLGFLFVPVILVNRYLKDKYDFIIMLTTFFGQYGLTSDADLHFPVYNLAFLCMITCAILLKKNATIRKLLLIAVVYLAGLLVFAMLSEETMRVQYITILRYMGLFYCLVPIAVFSGLEFDMKIFSRKVITMTLLCCIFYIIDSVIFSGPVLFPRDTSYMATEIIPTFNNLYINPLSFHFIRHWPDGIFILLICIAPFAKMFKLNKTQWVIIILALLVCRTFMLIVTFGVLYLLAIGKGKKIIIYTIAFLGLGTVLYFVDSSFPTDEDDQSPLRISSSVDQLLFFDIEKADDEDVAELGSTRGAQIVPKFELLYELDREWVGFGFLHRELTTNPKYIIYNELYLDPEQAEEVAIGVECMPANIILQMGYLGLIFHIAILIWLWLTVSKLKGAFNLKYAMIAFICVGLTGLAGGLTSPKGLFWTSLVLAAVILSNKKELRGFELDPNKKAIVE